MLNRRDFIKSVSTAGAMGLVRPMSVLSSDKKTSGYFGVHSFVENHPEAVFIMRTDVDVKTNAQAMKNAGLKFGRSVFVQKTKGKGSIPLTHRVAVKPNITNSFTSKEHYPKQAAKYPLEYGMGIITDPYFVEGSIEAMKELGLSGSQFNIREVNCPWDFGPRGYLAMAERTGADIRDQNTEIGKISKDEINWVDVPDGWIHKKFPYLWPINTRDSWLLNISKFKAHGMGLTLCCKNHQGSIALHYQQFCGNLSALKKINKKHLVRNYEKKCNENFERHLSWNIPRWNRPSKHDNGLRMDVWAARTLDNLSASPTGLFVVEGVYGRDGDGFLGGPNKGKIDDREAWDYMTNIVIFGKNAFNVDIVGHWLRGHEPGNFGLFHLAVERGMTDVINPMDIPVYLWEDGKATLTPLTSFERTPLKTYYLQRDYDGHNEPKFHLVNEPFDYSSLKMKRSALPVKPNARIFTQQRLNPVNPIMPIEYAVPRNGYARLEIMDTSFRPLELIADGFHKRGYHMAAWDTKKRLSGTYLYRFRFEDYNYTSTIML